MIPYDDLMRRMRIINDIGQRTRKFTHWSCEDCDRPKYGDWTGNVATCVGHKARGCGKQTLKEYSVVLLI